MIDMRYEQEELKDFSTPSAEVPKYPYGLKLCLGKNEIEKLGIKNPQINQKMEISAIVEVVEISSENEGGDESSMEIELQVKEMEIKKDEDKSSTSVMYGE